jgi:hypothetical protein
MTFMRNAAALLFVATVLTACSGPGDDGPSIVEGTEPIVPPVLDDTGWPPGDLGNFHLAYHVNTGEAEVVVVASASQPGFLNFAQCSVRGVPCLGGIPSDEDDWKDIDLDQDVDRDTISTKFLGFEISFGPYLLAYKEDPETAFGYYGASVDVADLPEDRLIGPTWAGQWQEYTSDDDLHVSRPIEVLNPGPGQNIVFTNGELVPLEWVPTGEGEVTLLVSTRFTLARLFNLEDDGYFELDVDSLGLTNTSEEITFTFTRWNQETLNTYGHVVDLLATSDMSFTGQFYNIGNRDPLEPADGCVEATGLPALESGGYWGWLGSMDEDLAADANCLGAGSATGKDAIVRIELESHESVAVEYNTYTESAAVYLLTECDNVGSCVAGSDLDDNDDVVEYISYFNVTDEPETLYLVLDTTLGGDTVFTLDLDITPVLPPDMYDACGGADGAAAAYPTVLPGNYYGELTPWVDDLNPGAGGCTGTSLGGAEAMTPIEVGAYQTLQVTVSMPGHDPGLYLLTDCATAFSCLAGADVNLSGNEGIQYTNAGASPQTVYLVLDSKTGVGPYFMNVGLSP